ncbi:MAG: hypothetical protein D6683_10320, partial [Actinomyces sp.]
MQSPSSRSAGPASPPDPGARRSGVRPRSGIRLAVALVGVVVASMLAVLPAAASDPGDHDDAGEVATYRVTLTNLTAGQPLTPAVLAASDDGVRLFRTGRSASPGLAQLAENGGVPVLAAEAAARPRIAAVEVVGAAPIAPGASTTQLVTLPEDAEYVSLAAMLVCTNDGFAGISRLRLPEEGRTRSRAARAYDAGTEINTEAYADLVPPCDGMGGSGMSNPALAEGGVVHRHRGITGVADLDPAVHGWDGPVMAVTITRVRVYEVTLTNLTAGQPLTPAVLAVHRGEHKVFRTGRPASAGLAQLAENGGVPVLAAELAARRAIADVGVVGAAPIGPGGSASSTLVIDGRGGHASLAAMLVCTNDGFAGLDSVDLPDEVGDTATWDAAAYDAGTEMNTEAYADLVPPCDGMGGSGMSNPALAEGGVVSPHAGITGVADLDPAVHGWSGPV